MTTNLLDYDNLLTEPLMGHANIEDDELTDEEAEAPGPVTTLADLDPVQFTQLLANVIGPAEISVAPTQSPFNASRNDLEEGEIREPPSRRPTVAPFTKSPHAAQKPPGVNRKTARAIRGCKNEASKQIQEASKQANTFVFAGFLFEVAAKQKQKPYACRRMLDLKNKPSSVTEWLDGKHARRAVSQDGYDLVVHIPGGIKDKSKSIFTDLLVEYGNAANLLPTTTADIYHRNNPNSYEFREGEVSGVKHFVKCWHAVSHSCSEPVISKDLVRTCGGFHHATALLAELSLLSLKVNAWLQNIDPIQYRSQETLMEKVEDSYPYMRALKVLDPLLMEGRAIMFNRTTPTHRDHRDPPKAWACLVVLGGITAGTLYFPRLNLRVRYLPGDVVWLRGYMLEHEVEVWEGPQRICIAHFTHQSLYDCFDVECETGKAL